VRDIFGAINGEYEQLGRRSSEERAKIIDNETYDPIAAIIKSQSNYFALLIKNPVDDRIENQSLLG